MKLRQSSQSILHSILLLTCLPKCLQASPLTLLANVIHQAEREVHVIAGSVDYLFGRQACANPCGYYKQLCCQTGQTCITNSSGQAACAAAAGQTTSSGSWQTYTSTYVETGLVTVTSTYSSWIAAATNTQCNYAANQSPCGSSCCQSGFYCSTDLQCVAAGNGGFTTTGVVGVIPARPTTISGVIVTQTIVPTTTVPYQTPVATGTAQGVLMTGSTGLSGGAIAGIVIGTLVGLALLWLLCFYCLLEWLCGCLGLRKKKKSRNSTYTEEQYTRNHRRTSQGSRAWTGASQRSQSDRQSRSRPPPPPPAKKSGRLSAFVTGAATAAAASLFTKKKTSAVEKPHSEYTGSSYDSSYYYDYDSRDSRSRRTSLPRTEQRSQYTSRTRSVRR